MKTSNILKLPLLIVAQVSMLDAHRHITCQRGAPQILASTYATIDVQISSSVNLPTQRSYFTVTHTRASPSFRAPPDVHHGSQPSQDFMGIQRQRRSLPNVPASQHLQHTQNSSLNFPFAHGASS